MPVGRDSADGRLLLAGMCIFLALMLGFPTLANLWYSFSDISFQTLRDARWIGFQHYADALGNADMWVALWFSVKFGILCMVAECGLALVLVWVLNPLVVRRPWLTAFLMLPMMISPALLGVMYRLILNEFVGVVPQYLEMLGLFVNFLGTGGIYPTVVAIEILQWTPFAFLILLAARQSVSTEIEEAAEIDGAGGWTMFRHIHLPLLRPTLLIVAFIRFIDGFRVFDHIFVLTGGGPGNKTTSISIFIYKLFFVKEELGQAIAVSILLLAMSLTLLTVAMRFAVRRN